MALLASLVALAKQQQQQHYAPAASAGMDYGGGGGGGGGMENSFVQPQVQHTRAYASHPTSHPATSHPTSTLLRKQFSVDSLSSNVRSNSGIGHRTNNNPSTYGYIGSGNGSGSGGNLNKNAAPFTPGFLIRSNPGPGSGSGVGIGSARSSPPTSASSTRSSFSTSAHSTSAHSPCQSQLLGVDEKTPSPLPLLPSFMHEMVGGGNMGGNRERERDMHVGRNPPPLSLYTSNL